MERSSSSTLRSLPCCPAARDAGLPAFSLPELEPLSVPGEILRVAVLGAGAMGSQIAALLANAGLDVNLLDLPTENDPAGLARSGLARIEGARPAVFFAPDCAQRVRPGNLDDLSCLREVDWVVEAVVEDLSLKKTVLSRVARAISPSCVVSSNTSGLSIRRLCEALPSDLHARFLGVHFFNPVRQMKLVELIPSDHTDPAVADRMTAFVEESLGKRVVECRDTPNFIANRLGVFALMDALHRMEEANLSVGQVDAVTGTLLGRPRSATLRLCDLIGLDTLVKVAGTAYDNLVGERQRETFAPPGFVERMIEAGLLGAKAGAGFYRKTDAGIEAIDCADLDYRPSRTPDLGGIESVVSIRDAGQRLQGVHDCDAEDEPARFARDHLNAVLRYALEHADSMASELIHIDEAMKYGFNWELGPFETIDAIGTSNWIRGAEGQGAEVPALIAQMDRAGGCAYRTDDSGFKVSAFSIARGSYLPSSFPQDDTQLLRISKVCWQGEGGSVFDVDGIGVVVFGGKMNVIGMASLEILYRALDAGFRALVVGGANGNFSAGADLAHMVASIEAGDWPGLVSYLDHFQEAVMGLRHAPIAVVAAPVGLALGGGCEICLVADRRVPAAELRMGLVETSVGLIPGAGGCVELARRCGAGRDIASAFDVVFSGRFSSSADEASEWGLLEPGDDIQMNGDRVLKSALAAAEGLLQGVYDPPEDAPFPVAGTSARDTLLGRLEERRKLGEISAHDHLIGRLLADVLSGGKVGQTACTERELLDLEREAFLELCHTPETLERMVHMLKTGKSLRN